MKLMEEYNVNYNIPAINIIFYEVYMAQPHSCKHNVVLGFIRADITDFNMNNFKALAFYQ